MKQRKKLIEVSIPLEAINAASAREKSIRHGHPSTLHLWWARRPLAACRAVLFAQLVDDPSSWPDKFPTEEAVEAERKRLHKLIGGTKEADYRDGLVAWESSNNEEILNAARWEIARSVAWGRGEDPPPKDDAKAILDYLQTKAPPVYDPFCGGGSIPLEAQRLGLRAYGSDLNPVAVLISKALVEIPPKFAGLPPVNSEAQAELKRGGRWNGKGAQGLAEDVRYYGQWMRDEAEKRIGHLYPKAKLPDGSEATVIAWIWARTVRSPDPAAKGAMVPLVSSFILSTNENRKTWVKPTIDPQAPDGYRFEVATGRLSKADEERLKLGTKGGKGQAFICILTGSTVDRTYIQAEGKAGRLGERLMAIVAEGARGRIYVPATSTQEAIARSPSGDSVVTDARATCLSPQTPTRAMITGGVCSAYGLRTYGHLFTPRQLLSLVTYCDLVSQARAKTIADAQSIGMAASNEPLHSGGSGGVAYADAVATYLGLVIGRCADAWSALTSWSSTGEFIRNTFARQAMPMVWDFCECNPFSGSTGSFSNGIEWTTGALATAPAVGHGEITQITAQENNYPVWPALISTDPPYYDNIGYADLSDFFYIWHRRSLARFWPELYRRLTAPKDAELVATSYRHGGRSEAELYFMKGMGQALIAMRTVATEGEPLAIYYAFKQSEKAEEGIISPGWASFLQAVVDAGIAIDGTWPVRTERGARSLSLASNALASSIVLACRKRDANTPAVTRSEFIQTLKRKLSPAIDDMRKAGVGPVDMQQAVIGPGMGIFTRYGKVLEDDDSPMSVKTALALINREWDDVENAIDAALDPETQVALAWYADYGFDARPSGILIQLTTSKDTSDRALFQSEIFKDLKGKAALKPREDLSDKWSPDFDSSLTVWQIVQQTARLLNAEDGGAEAAARLLAQMGPKAADARLLAERLYQIASQKGWNQEALVYNELAQEWPRLEELAQLQIRAHESIEAAQPRLL